jgi:hypothetical protein
VLIGGLGYNGLYLSDSTPYAEFGAAFFGAVAAFALEAIRRWREERRKELRAGNEAIFVLSQMYSVMRNFHQQAIVDRAAFVRQGVGREPKYLEYIPFAIAWNPQTVLPISSLGFLLESHEPDVLNRLAQVERAFLSVLEVNVRRSQVHVQFQERARAVLGPAQEMPSDELEAKVGFDLAMQLQQFTAHMLEDVPRTRDGLLEMGKQLRSVLELEYPLGRIVGFTPFDNPVEGLSPPTNLRRPSLWRRWLRTIVNLKRRREAPALPPSRREQ